jgi:hypothetical protein
MYDLFYVSKVTVNEKIWKTFSQRFPRAQKLENVKTFNDIKSKAFTKLFWVVWDDLTVADDFNFEYTVPKWDLEYIHVFKNKDYFDGITLFPKSADFTQREFENRFFINNKKEINIVASYSLPYDIFYINSYDEYLSSQQTSATSMFWVVWKEIDVVPNFKFDYRIPKYEQHLTHVFKNGEYFDGVCIFSKNITVSKKEFENRFFISNKKEIDIVASIPKPFDIIFISYNEPDADKNFTKLTTRFPRAKRVHGVKGIHQAHIKAAELSTTEMLWIVDADAIIVNDFDFSVEQIPYYSSNARRMLTTTVHVWRSRNPVNGLEYGYGGVKLLPRQLTLDMDVNSADMTTSISKSFKAMPTVSNITAFNVDAFSTWRSAFRECVKLSSKVIDGQVDEETQARLYFWCKLNTEVEFGTEAYLGALAGVNYGEENKDNHEALKKINDFDWLKEQYEI